MFTSQGRAGRVWRLRGMAVLVATVGVLAVSAPFTLAGTIPNPPPVGDAILGAQDLDDLDVTLSRIGGQNRFETAARIAEATFEPADTTVALVAAADEFPDALAGAVLAGVERAPILLVRRDEVPPRTHEALQALDVQRVIVLGGVDSVGAGVEAALAARYQVERVAGNDRYETAAAVAERAALVRGPGAISGDRAALLVNGERDVDAVIGAPLAYSGHVPVLLTRPGELPDATAGALGSLDIGRVLVLGGEAVVSSAVERDLERLGLAVDRVAGQRRTDTAARFAGMLVNRWGYDRSSPMLASGQDFVDALAAGPRGGALRVPILLTRDADDISDETGQWLEARCPDVGAIEAVGGVAVVSPAALEQAVAAAARCTTPDPKRVITYQTGTRGTVHANFSTFRKRAAEALADARGWSLDGDIRFEEVDRGGQFRLWLASPQSVANAAGVCSANWSCRVGNDVYINDLRWRESTTTFRGAGRSLTEYRWYVVNHEVGHWLGHGHYQCGGAGRPAPVMQQQSINLQGCTANVWPLAFERDAVRRWWVP
jgi:putative cell wall-binding protein